MKLIDLTGQKFGRLLVVSRSRNDETGRARWTCACDCGTVVIIHAGNLRSPNTRSCGCLRRDVTGRNHIVHGDAIRGRLAPEYNSWHGMIRRCTNPRDAAFSRYGGRGIVVCNPWLNSYKTFLHDMGRKPSGDLSIERIDNDLGYEPGNCRWATAKEQANNCRVRRDARLLELRGEVRRLFEWARLFEIHPTTLRGRISRGLPVEHALRLPIRGKAK